MTEEAFLEVIANHPYLCADGLGVGGARLESRFENLRRELSHECFSDFHRACRWLSLCTRVKKPNRFKHSLELKHDAAKFMGDRIRHGAFVAAALHLSIPHSREKNQPYCIYLAISSKLPENNKPNIG